MRSTKIEIMFKYIPAKQEMIITSILVPLADTGSIITA